MRTLTSYHITAPQPARSALRLLDCHNVSSVHETILGSNNVDVTTLHAFTADLCALVVCRWLLSLFLVFLGGTVQKTFVGEVQRLCTLFQ